MPNYEEMYVTLFRETKKAIDLLQEAQRKTEEIYICDENESNILTDNFGKPAEEKDR